MRAVTVVVAAAVVTPVVDVVVPRATVAPVLARAAPHAVMSWAEGVAIGSGSLWKSCQSATV